MVQIDVDLMKTVVKCIDSFPEVWVAKDLREAFWEATWRPMLQHV